MFMIVGLQDFFCDQVPDQLYLSIFGLGSFVSCFLVSLIGKVTMSDEYSWFVNNLNRAHIDYFYWLLVSLSGVDLIAFFFFARVYVYKRKEN
ncbi:hypothetical protein LUZ60_001781 [Juncus effusus]|nr:hypothetical protein LUZ60_001781 [Juncus effusus]